MNEIAVFERIGSFRADKDRLALQTFLQIIDISFLTGPPELDNFFEVYITTWLQISLKNKKMRCSC